MKKAVIIMLAGVLLAMSLVGCHKAVPIDDEDNTVSESGYTMVDGPAETTTEEKIPASVDWRDCKIILDGKEITLPCTYDDIVSAGWKLPDGFEDSVIKPTAEDAFKASEYDHVEKDGAPELGIYFMNTSDKPITLKEATVAGISVQATFDDDIDKYDYSKVVFPGDMIVGKTYSADDAVDGIEKLYGTPDAHAGSTYENHYYYGKSNPMVLFEDVDRDGTVLDGNKNGYFDIMWTPRIKDASGEDFILVKKLRIDLTKEILNQK